MKEELFNKSMKNQLVFLGILFSVAISQKLNFRINEFNDSEIIKKSENISYLSSLWLADKISIGPNNNNKLIIKVGYSTFLGKINNLNWVLPNFNIAFKLTDNLFVSGKYYGIHLEYDIPQINGTGLQYFFGNDHTLVFSYQKNSLNGLTDFKLVSNTYILEKNLPLSFGDLFFSVASNSYQQKNYYTSSVLLNEYEGDINFIGIKILVPISSIKVGVFANINQRHSFLQLSLSKSFL